MQNTNTINDKDEHGIVIGRIVATPTIGSGERFYKIVEPYRCGPTKCIPITQLEWEMEQRACGLDPAEVLAEHRREMQEWLATAGPS